MFGKQEGFGVPHRTQNGIVITSSWGYGSVATKIPNFTTPSAITGSCPGIVFSTDSVNGCRFLCQEQGMYFFSWSASFTGQAYFGFTLNSTQLTTDVENQTDRSTLAVAITQTTNTPLTVSTCVQLFPGDIVRPHAEGSSVGGQTPFLRACRLS